MKSSILFAVCFLVSCIAFAQRDTIQSRIHYFNSFHAGGLFAKKGYGSGESFSTIHGIRFRKVAVGAGLGYDAYLEWRTAPVFLSVSYDLLPLWRNPLFIQMNGGVATAWRAIDQTQVRYKYKPGLCLHPVIGYRIDGNKFRLYLTAGYKFQSINYEQISDWWIGAPGSKFHIARDMERVSVQFGFGFR